MYITQEQNTRSVRTAPYGTGQRLLIVTGEKCKPGIGDEDGDVQAVSARCTHLGCIVHFNDAERAWECPCHGSRFATDGTVVQGPANRPLAPHRLPTGPEESD